MVIFNVRLVSLLIQLFRFIIDCKSDIFSELEVPTVYLCDPQKRQTLLYWQKDRTPHLHVLPKVRPWRCFDPLDLCFMVMRCAYEH